MMDNPQAFPRVVPDYRDATYVEGMTLRDYFAGQVITGYFATDDFCGVELIAKDAYELADAMLKERINND